MSKRILVLSSYRFWPVMDGGHHRIWNLFSELSDKFAVTFLTTEWSGENKFLRFGNNSYISITPGKKIVNLARNHISKFGHYSWDLASLIYGYDFPNIGEIITKSRADYVVLVRIWLYPLRVFFSNKPIILDCHDVESQFIKSKGPKSSVSKFVEAYEKYVVRHVDLVLACTESDAQIFRNFGAKHVEVIPNGFISKNSMEESKYNFGSESKIVFVGSGHGPNLEAALDIVGIAKDLPEFNFVIIGGVSLHPKMKNELKNIELKGYLSEDELAKELSNALAFINPVKSGSGSSLKVALASSFGLPIVGTRFGIRGYEDLYSEMFIEASSNLEYKRAFKQLTESYNSKESEKLIDKSKDFAWGRMRERLEKILDNFSPQELVSDDIRLLEKRINEISKLDSNGNVNKLPFFLTLVLKKLVNKIPLKIKRIIFQFLKKKGIKKYIFFLVRLFRLTFFPFREFIWNRKLLIATRELNSK